MTPLFSLWPRALLVTLLLLPQLISATPSEEADDRHAGEDSKSGKLLSLFGVVRFKNSPCNTSGGDAGVCYTPDECTSIGGRGSGSCAAGYGVCCSFTVGCGEMSSENNTYFTSSESDTSPCLATICKCSADICQLRLDFDTFNIAGPDTSETATASNNGIDAVQATQCIDATFTASSEGHMVPVICGNNQGMHMILEAEESCNVLQFAWNTNAARMWRIRVSQRSCNDRHKPPEGCLQYFTGVMNTIQSYNWLGGSHLASQRYWNCIRQEQGFCQINYATAPDEFQLDGYEEANSLGAAAGGVDYDSNDINSFFGAMCSRDYVIIPFGRGQRVRDNVDRYCGAFLTRLDTKNANEPAEGTVSSQITPFMLGFVTDGGEQQGVPNAAVPTLPGVGIQAEDSLSRGFKIVYEQTMNCVP